MNESVSAAPEAAPASEPQRCPKMRTTVMLTAKLRAWFEDLGDGNLSAGLLVAYKLARKQMAFEAACEKRRQQSDDFF